MNTNYWQSGEIRLRALEETDLQLFIESRNSPDSVREWYEDRILFPFSASDIKADFEQTRTEYSGGDKRIFVIERLDGEPVGQISVWHLNSHNRYFRYGIYLNAEYRGKGYGKSALIILLDYYFNELNYNKCSPTVYSYNFNSQKFHENFGFQLEGVLREEVFTRGQYFDMNYYGMLRSEFNALYKHFTP